jgi:isopenicillin-N epimerase
VIDHVTSPTGLVLPVAEIISDLAERGVETIVDGAHAPGQVELDVDSLGAAGYTGNWHKWTCAPKGAGFVSVRSDWRASTAPLVISHGAGQTGGADVRFRAMFDWTGTADPTPYLTVPFAVEYVGTLLEGGWPAIRRRNRQVALGWRTRLIDELGWTVAGSDALTASMVSLRVPLERRSNWSAADAGRVLLRQLDEGGVAVGVATRRGSDDLYLRISAHLHTEPGALDPLLEALSWRSP